MKGLLESFKKSLQILAFVTYLWLSHQTIANKIQDLSKNTKDQLTENLKIGNCFL